MSEAIEHLVLTGNDPGAWGEQHGEARREQIAALYAIRIELTLQKTDLADEAQVVALAQRHVPLLREFDAALMSELEGISRSSGLSLAQLVVVNHYTDLRDLGRRHLTEQEAQAEEDDGGCSVIYAPGDDGALLGQTWDMHGSATDHVFLLEVPGDDGERTLLFSISGCLGMTGLTSWGLGMTINNLNSVDARVGVVWPTLVRRALRCRTAAEARDVVLDAPLGSGHHYVVADEREVYGVETSGTRKKLTQSGADAVHLHTNHCVDPEMADTARILPTSTTERRLATLQRRVAQGHAPRSAQALWDGLGEVSAGRDPAGTPHAVATCGAFVMDLAARRALACKAVPTAGDVPAIIELKS
jgi:isopenicillin-N N-acyltransferase-like protein